MKNLAVTIKSQNRVRVQPKRKPLSADAEWQLLQEALAECLESLEEDDFLILTAKMRPYYVQFADQGRFGMRVEAASNTFIQPGDDDLSEEAYATMQALGWNPPGAVDSTPKSDSNGSPNFYLDAVRPIDFGWLAGRAVQSFRLVYKLGHPGMLQYRAFHRVSSDRSAELRFPTLRIKREEP